MFVVTYNYKLGSIVLVLFAESHCCDCIVTGDSNHKVLKLDVVNDLPRFAYFKKKVDCQVKVEFNAFKELLRFDNVSVINAC